MVQLLQVLSSALLVGSFVAAHPGHDINVEIAERAAYLTRPGVKRDLSHCAETLKARGVTDRTQERRAAAVASARRKRSIAQRASSLRARQLDESHNSTGLGYDLSTANSTVFGGEKSCILTPETTQGPYWVEGEFVRWDVTDGEPGVDLYLDLQVIDVNTCEPVPDILLEQWHCNSTGVYGGVVAGGNGNTNDATNLDSTFLRGIQKTDSDGIVQFKTIFPGHYTGRATHIHVLSHQGGTLLPNSTVQIGSGTVSHVGQVFFDQTLISAVELTSPYTANTQQLTTNANDGILSQEATGGVDPLVEYVYLGPSVEDGLFAWLAFGINTTASYDVEPAVYYYKEGGVANPNAGSGGPGGPGGPPPS